VTSRASGRGRTRRGAPDADADRPAAGPAARSGFVSPPSGAPVRGDDLGAVPGPDAADDEE
jgi:hypothetical protein